MRILVTGAGGNLGRAVIPLLAERGDAVRALDARPVEIAGEVVQGDVRDPGVVARAVEGVGAVVHAVALHGVHLKSWSPHEFWSTNVTGTFNVYEAAWKAGVRTLVLASTMGVYGESLESRDGTWAFVTEEAPARPKDVYGLSKWLCEELGRYYARTRRIATVALRLGMFVPESFERYGFRLLFGGVDERDVAQVVLRALEFEPDGGFDCFNVMAATPFSADDAHELAVDLEAVLERYWPGCGALFAERGLDVAERVWGRHVFAIEKAERLLGYRPRYGFREFLDALREGRTEHYPSAGLAQWGV